MATKQELQAQVAKARAAIQEYDCIVANIVLALEEMDNPLDDDQHGDSTSALYDELVEVEAHVDNLP
jgi:hypothetical protein